jgi:hypothetical protein
MGLTEGSKFFTRAILPTKNIVCAAQVCVCVCVCVCVSESECVRARAGEGALHRAKVTVRIFACAGLTVNKVI